jgi:hypothetical protein
MRFSIVGFVLLLGLVGWAWDGSHHDHGGPHGQPMTIRQIERETHGAFTDDTGAAHVVQSSSCRPGEDGNGTEPNTHYVCDLTFTNGSTDNVVVHILPDELTFKSSAG